MVGALTPSSFLARQLDSQRVNSNLSIVRPISCPVDPMLRYRSRAPFTSGEPRLALGLKNMQNLFEWAYGFRTAAHPGQRPTRRAPSAGALYPTELFLVAETPAGWRTLYYDFAGHRFYDAPVSDADEMAFALGLDRGRVGVLFHSVLWRTVQRYGVRGYRYCLLDAAHVAANLVRAARACGLRIAVDPGVVTARLEDLMKLDHAEALTAALACDLPAGGQGVGEPPIASPRRGMAGETIEDPPILSPLLSRVIAFHRETLYHVRRRSDETVVETRDSLDDLHFWARQRYSAKDFTGGAAGYEDYAAIIRSIAQTPPLHFAPSASLIPYVIRLNVEGTAPGCESIRTGETSPQTGNMAEARNYLWRASQKQEIVRASAFAVVFAASKRELAAGGSIAYRHTILNAGVACAELYREAAGRSLGTTSIGGFSDDAISGFLGDPGLHPIVIQAFGAPSMDAEKIDAARIVAPRALPALPNAGAGVSE
jgi:hypothetical protein